MLRCEQVEELVCLISSLDRPAITRQLLEFHADFPVDFTPTFLSEQTLERLRHLLFALCVQCQHMPDASTPVAA